MIVSLAMTDLLIVREWNPIKLIMRNSEGNINKFNFVSNNARTKLKTSKTKLFKYKIIALRTTKN